MFNLIDGFSMSECSELITCAYNSVAWYKMLAEKSEVNYDYWMQRAEDAERVAEKLNNAYSKELYAA
jgi:hypothetical protein